MNLDSSTTSENVEVNSRYTVGSTPANGPNARIDDIGTIPNIEILAVEPQVDDELVYLEVAPPVAGGEGGAQLAVAAKIRNNGSKTVKLESVKFDFVSALGETEVASELYKADGWFNTDTLDPGETKTIHIQRIEESKTINLRLPSDVPLLVHLEFQFEGFTQPLKITRKLRRHQSENGGKHGSYLFPGKASDLGPGEFWGGQSSGVGSHHEKSERFAYDMGVARYDAEQDRWTSLRPGADSENKKIEDYLVFGRPIYAVAAGVIEKLVDDHPDQPLGQETSSANVVHIRCGDEQIRYLHLKQNSIDPDLKVGDSVTAGQFLALCGNTGNSSAPHLHIDCRHAETNQLRPLPFHNAFAVDRDELAEKSVFSGPVVKLNGRGPAWGKDNPSSLKNVKNAIWPAAVLPQQVTRLGDSGSQAGRVKMLDAIALSPSRIVTAVLGSNSNRLRLIEWQVSADGKQVKRTADSGDQAGTVSAISLADLGSGQFATAVRTAEGTLKVIQWASRGTSLVRLGDSGGQAGEIDLVAAAVVAPGRLITAVKGSNTKRLKLILWDVRPDGMGIERIADSGAQAGGVDRLSIATVAPDCVATAVRASSNERLNVIAWHVGGEAITRFADSGNQAGSIDLVAAAPLGPGRLATNIRGKHSGQMRLIVWLIDSDGAAVTRLGDSGNQVGEVDLLSVATPGNDFAVTPVQGTSSQQLRVISWGIGDF